MYDYDSNVYYNPENYGLEVVAEFDYIHEPYEFDLIVVWRDIKTRRLYYAEDSGCSCPSPFEDTSVSDLIEIESYASFRDHVKASGSYQDPHEFLSNVAGLLMQG